ncbi:hypothetical protein QFC22_000215 [Naganishia vaughanmartiniae]|uniref:Uncharacterized protein n=1 Tax=Naganishia vaughanmartiniae TaxID=1424756 RepID=A0ACC2XMH0_9TREE|nr:hypothetical protein QFC22_000215 [Naganishia vaughanmartiniae]
MAVILHAKIVSKPEFTEDVKKQLLSLKDVADNKEEGTLIYRVNQAIDDKNTFILFEEYKDEAAFEAHKAGEGFQALSAKAGEWLAEPLLLRFLQACHL